MLSNLANLTKINKLQNRIRVASTSTLTTIMQVFAVTVFLFCLVFSLADDDHGSDAKSYSAEEFDAELDKTNHFVMFFAPWCGHCKRLSPTWNELANLYNSMMDPPLIIAKVDCTVETALCAKHDVTGYPTLKFFKDSKSEASRYKGPRDLESLQTFIENQLSDAHDEEEAEAAAPSTGPVIELTDDNFSKHVETGSHFIKFYAPWCGHCKRLAPTWEELAGQFSGDKTVTIAKVDCTVHRATCDSFSVRGYPTLFFFKNGEKVDQYLGSRDLGELKDYVKRMLEKKTENADVNEGKVPDEKPSDDDEPLAAVFPLDDETFEPAISEGLTFVKFYAPWCGHCKQLAPTWEELSKKMAEHDSVKIAKVDCTVHKELCRANEVRGYPTIVLYKEGEKITEYLGRRDIDSLVNFMNKHLFTGEMKDEL